MDDWDKCKHKGRCLLTELDGNPPFCAICRINELEKALLQYHEAFEFTRQYVGYDMLPPIKGWSWFDADVAGCKVLDIEPPKERDKQEAIP